jgi:maltooligosyltrehalose trehalohydrolase
MSSTTGMNQPQRRFPVGAEPLAGGGVHFRVWAPKRRRVQVALEDERGNATVLRPLAAEQNGYFSGVVQEARPGAFYRFQLDDDNAVYPDPVSRFQPRGPHGPSQVIDPAFDWTDGNWPGVTLEGQVIYEMHIGTFTPDGVWAAAEEQLPELADLGITVLEVMPVADFPGRFGWGYDGVNFFAPTRLYGVPDDFRRFVDRAHALGLGVILDVVYNHFGPDGNYLGAFADEYASKRYKTDWGPSPNFDGDNAGPVREFVLANVAYWIGEFHLDGLRLDATQNVYDSSQDHILAAITRTARQAAGKRNVIVVAENEPQETKLVRPQAEGGFGMDALWNDDFHHSAMVLLTGRKEAYYSDYLGSPQEFISAVKYGYLYQGQWYHWQKQGRGMPSFGIKPAAFVAFTQNHDQVANTFLGRRCHMLAGPGEHRAMTALTLLAPSTPMLFQGQEFAASSPFLFFADHKPELARLVDRGRREFMAQFSSLSVPEVLDHLPNPSDPETFERSKLKFAERQEHAEAYALHRDLLRLRREDPVFRAQRPGSVDGAILEEKTFVLRFFGEKDDDRLLLVNFGIDLKLSPLPEPLVAPPFGKVWEIRWSSEDVRYGGAGQPPFDTAHEWKIPGASALVFGPTEPPLHQSTHQRSDQLD